MVGLDYYNLTQVNYNKDVYNCSCDLYAGACK